MSKAEPQKPLTFADLKAALQFHVTVIGIISRSTAESLLPGPYKWATSYALEALEGDGIIIRAGPEKYKVSPPKHRAGRVPSK